MSGDEYAGKENEEDSSQFGHGTLRNEKPIALIPIEHSGINYIVSVRHDKGFNLTEIYVAEISDCNVLNIGQRGAAYLGGRPADSCYNGRITEGSFPLASDAEIIRIHMPEILKKVPDYVRKNINCEN